MRVACKRYRFRFHVNLFTAVLLAMANATAASAAPDPPDPDALLDELGRRAHQWFQRCRHPRTGLVLDRAANDKSVSVDPSAPAVCSIASVGYFLTLLPESARLGYLSKHQAIAQARQTLHTTLTAVEHHDGVLYHFVDWRNGKRWKTSEVSTFDTAILFNGAMTCAVAFGGPVEQLADQLIDRARWTAYLVERPRGGRLLALGWSPEAGLLGPADRRSSEAAMAYFLAIGARTHPIDAECWYRTHVEYQQLEGRRVLNARHPLFTALYGLGWHDLQGRPDRDGVDLFANARLAALANRAYCRRSADAFPLYALEAGGWWGITAGDSPTGYIAPGPGDEDGTVWPTATLASLPFIAGELADDLKCWRASPAWRIASGDFGLAPFQLNDEGKWVARELIGIDLGSFAVALCNYRNQTVWRLWMRHAVARAAIRRLALWGAE